MNRWKATTTELVWTLIVVLASSVVAYAKPAPWQTEKGYQNGIPIGTKITLANWQRYQEFMDPGLVTLFQGTSFWHLPQDVEIDVGPTYDIPFPKPYRIDTEKYGSQVQLESTPQGGYYPKGYVAGLPFPLPRDGDKSPTAGAKVYWDTYYRPHPRLEEAPLASYTLDEYNNWTQTGRQIAAFSMLSYLSDPPFPRETPNNGGYSYAIYIEETAPEQAKYFTVLILYWQDPLRLNEEYQFVPSLRRSLRLSQAAHCAPLFGTDFDIDDTNFNVPLSGHLFKYQFLGVKKVLVLAHGALDAVSSLGTATTPDPKYTYLGGKGILPFPRPTYGAWEVRDAFVVAMQRLPQFATGYCYSNRIVYVDTQSLALFVSDVWDSAGKLYKWFFNATTPSQLGGLGVDGQIYTYTGGGTTIIANFLDSHATDFPGLMSCVDDECDPSLMDVTRYALPEGLMKIGQ